MKVSAIQKILLSLSANERKGLLSRLRDVDEQQKVVELTNYLLKSKDLSESKILETLNLSKWQKASSFNSLFETLVAFLEGEKDTTKLVMKYNLAHDLVFSAEYEAATEIIRVTIRIATEVEEYGWVIMLWRLVEPMDPKPKIEGMTSHEAHRLKANLDLYEALANELDLAAHIPETHLRHQAVEKLRDLPSLESPLHALSQRALYWYWKVKAACFVFLRDYPKAIPVQEEILKHIEQHPWVTIDPEYAEAKETKGLGQLLQITKQETRFKEVLDTLQGKRFKSKRAELEKAYLAFPWALVVAIQYGRQRDGDEAGAKFLRLLETNAFDFGPTFFTENLYDCLYFYLASQNLAAAGKVLKLIHNKQYTKPDFKPRFFTMYRFLAIIYEIENKEWADASRLIKNLSGSTGLDDLPGIRPALSFLTKAIDQWSMTGQNNLTSIKEEAILNLQQALENQDFVEFFDLMVWLQAKRRGCTMMQIFHEQATQQSDPTSPHKS